MAMSMIGAQATGNAAKFNANIEAENRARSADASADAASFNARVAAQMAKSEEERAAASAYDYRKAGSAKLASRRAFVAKSGSALEGSPLMIDTEIMKQIDFGANRIGFAGMVNANRLRNQQALLEVTAENDRATAKFAREAGAASAANIDTATNINMASAGLKGATSIWTTLTGKGGALNSWGLDDSKTKSWKNPDNDLYGPMDKVEAYS